MTPQALRAILLSSPLDKNILLRRSLETPLDPDASRLDEGRFAIVTDVGCGMRWTRLAQLTSARLADGEVVRS
jgi:hypothetical protein